MIHNQVDSGAGFFCDEGILELVLLMNKIPGIRTQFSCQGGGRNGNHRESAYVVFCGDLKDLENFCLRLRPLLKIYIDPCRTEEQHQPDDLKIMFQPDFIGRKIFSDGTFESLGGVRGKLDFAYCEVGRIIEAVRSLV